jgi:hypothetical protein
VVIESLNIVRLSMSDIRDKVLPSSKLNGLASNGGIELSLELDDATDSAVERCGRAPPHLPFV